MDCSTAIKKALKSRGCTQNELASRLGIKQGSVSNVLRQGNPHISTLANYLSAIGYEVAIVPTGTKLPVDAMIIESESQQSSE